jgi:hypothetical protein
MPPIKVSFGIQDAGGEVATLAFLIKKEDVTSLTVLSDTVSLLATMIRPIINGELVSEKATIDYGVSGEDPPEITSDIEEAIFFAGHNRNVGTGKLWASRYTIPSVKESMFRLSGAGVNVDTTLSAWTNFVATITAKIVNGGASVVNAHNDYFVEVTSAVQGWGHR